MFESSEPQESILKISVIYWLKFLGVSITTLIFHGAFIAPTYFLVIEPHFGQFRLFSLVALLSWSVVYASMITGKPAEELMKVTDIDFNLNMFSMVILVAVYINTIILVSTILGEWVYTTFPDLNILGLVVALVYPPVDFKLASEDTSLGAVVLAITLVILRQLNVDKYQGVSSSSAIRSYFEFPKYLENY